MPILELKDVNKSFGGLKAVANFNLSVEEGELVGLIGPNGAGKTTVFNLVTGVVPPTSGSIAFQGRSLAGLRPWQISVLGIARTFQNIRLFKQMTVLDNVRAVCHPTIRYNLADALLSSLRCREEEERITEEARNLLRTLNLGQRENHLAANLPYGDQRRLEIARALIRKPKLLLLDEPAAGMNLNEVKALVETIRWIKERFRLTVVLIEHQMGLVMNLCERVVVMDFGQIIAEGTPPEIQNNPRVLEAYLGKGVV